MFFLIQDEPIGRDQVQNAIYLDVLRRNKYKPYAELYEHNRQAC